MSLQTNNRRLASRRDFLTAGTGAVIGGLVSAGVGHAAPSTDLATPVNPAPFEAPPIPWHYRPLDVAAVRRRGYEAYSKYSCCYAASYALLATLKESSGAPWGTIPPEMFRFGAGGALGWGTLCGSLTGSLAILNLASARFEELGNELIGWYTTAVFPSLHHEAYARYKNQVTTVANSPLCHISVGTWARKAGARIHEKEKKDRCAKLTGDTAAMAAQLLNQALADKFVPDYKPRREFSHCLSCHQGSKSLLDNQQGKADCRMCHDEHPSQI